MDGLEGAHTTLLPSPPSETNRHDHLPSTALQTSTLPPSEVADEELRSKILRQVEFYFSDANLPTDDFLLKIIRRPSGSYENQEGWVPIKTLASFHKMKKLTRNIPTIVAALRTSIQLEVSPEGQRVRRLTPFDLNIDFDDIRSKTVLTWNLPEKPTIDYVIDLFSSVGEVAMARIRKADHPEPLLTRGLKIEIGKSTRDCYALIEYKTREDALKAVEKLHDETNWRSGLRVKLLLTLAEEKKSSISSCVAPSAKEKVLGKKKTAVKKKAVASDVDAAEVAAGEDATSHVDKNVKERPKPAWARAVQSFPKELQRDTSPAANCDAPGGGDGFDNTYSDKIDTIMNNKSNIGSVGGKVGQPRMPDPVKRGFGLGRGRTGPLTDSLSFKLLSLGGNSDAAAPGSSVDGKGEG